MIQLKVTEDKQSIQLVDFSLNSERTSLFSYFKRKSKKAAFNVLVDRGIWDGKDSFITKDGKIAIGLWKEIYKFSELYGIDCEIEGLDAMLNLGLDREKYLKYVDSLLSGVVDERGNPIEARDYQVEGAYRAVKHRFCTEELATSAGKTLIFYIYNSFLREGKKIDPSNKSLIIVPNISLVNQTAEKFELYSVGKRKWTICMIGGSNKFSEEGFAQCEIVISTYQSLQNLPKEFFKCFISVGVDECLHPSTEIKMADGTNKKISEISSGDIVFTTNDNTLELEAMEVDYVYHNLSKEEQMYEIELEDGAFIKITGNHKVKLINGKYKRVDQLLMTDEILSFLL